MIVRLCLQFLVKMMIISYTVLLFQTWIALIIFCIYNQKCSKFITIYLKNVMKNENEECLIKV